MVLVFTSGVGHGSCQAASYSSSQPASGTGHRSTNNTTSLGAGQNSSGAAGSGGQGGGGSDDPQRPPAALLPSDSACPRLQLSPQQALLQQLGIVPTPHVNAAAASLQQRSPMWYWLRTVRLTASDVAAAAGHSQYLTAGAVAAQKLAQLNSFLTTGQPAPMSSSSQEALTSEPTAAAAYLQQAIASSGPGVQLLTSGLYIHPSIPWLAASPGGIVQQSSGASLLEIKCPFKQSLPQVLPTEVRLQALAQLACQPPAANWRWVDVFYWTPPVTATFRVHWDAEARLEWEQDIMPRLEHWFFTQFAPAAAERMRQSRLPQSTPAGTAACETPPSAAPSRATPASAATQGEHSALPTSCPMA